MIFVPNLDNEERTPNIIAGLDEDHDLPLEFLESVIFFITLKPSVE